MTRKGYVNLAIPESLIKQVDKIVKNNSDGYVTRPEFIKEAIREKIRNMKR